MRLTEIGRILECEWLGDGLPGVDVEIVTCFAADLMSEVLAFCGPGALLLTGLANIQAIRTADIAELVAIVFVNDKKPPQSVTDSAREQGLPLMTTKLSMFAACGLLHGRGLRPALK
jgi:predicted transcriptional regulator